MTATGADYVLPYRFRKIRQLDRGWAVMAGSYITGQRMLDLLSREESSSALHAQEILHRGATAELALLEEMPDIGPSIQPSVLMGTPANADRTGIWVAQRNEGSEYTVQIAPDFAINWPSSILPEQKTEAQQAFFSSLNSFNHMGDLVRASAMLIGAARGAPDSSSFVQIGITWQSSETEFEARYIAGHVDEIAAMTNDEIAERSETLTP